MLSYCPALAAERNGARLQIGGVTLEASAQSEGVVFCVSATQNVKVSAMYGLTFFTDLPHRAQWLETLPKNVTAEGWDFVLPVRVVLKARPSDAPRPIEVRLGACSDHCEIETFKLVVPAFNARNSIATACSP